VKFLTTFLKKVEIRKVIYFRKKEQKKNERKKTLTTILVESASRVAKIEDKNTDEIHTRTTNRKKKKQKCFHTV